MRFFAYDPDNCTEDDIEFRKVTDDKGAPHA